jgi:Tfp pilus assembly protein PilN
MRPINLIPPEERRDRGRNSRTGPLAYVVVGALVTLLAGVVLVVLASNDIVEREDQITVLKSRQAALKVRADRLSPYVNFQQVAEERTQTISSLADSRFDWPRVIRQISRVLPPRVWFEKIKASASKGVAGEGGAADLNVAGPSMAMLGCAPGQKGVAAFAAALKDIDGVTRVGLNISTREFFKLKPDETGGMKKGFCGGEDMTKFELLIAFDASHPSPNDPDVGEITPPTGEGEAGAPEETPPPEGEPAAATESLGPVE